MRREIILTGRLLVKIAAVLTLVLADGFIIRNLLIGRSLADWPTWASLAIVLLFLSDQQPRMTVLQTERVLT